MRIISPAKRRLLHCHARTLAPDAPTTHLDLTYRRWVGCDPSDLLPENMSGTKTFSYGTGYYNPNYCGVHEGSSASSAQPSRCSG